MTSSRDATGFRTRCCHPRGVSAIPDQLTCPCSLGKCKPGARLVFGEPQHHGAALLLQALSSSQPPAKQARRRSQVKLSIYWILLQKKLNIVLVLKECFFSLSFCLFFLFFLNLVLTEQLAQPRRRGGQGLCDTNGVRGRGSASPQTMLFTANVKKTSLRTRHLQPLVLGEAAEMLERGKRPFPWERCNHRETFPSPRG